MMQGGAGTGKAAPARLAAASARTAGSAMAGLIVALLFFASMLGAQGALAQSVPVRSGEHADFSRLVIDTDSSEGWTLGRVEGGYEFRAVRSGIDYSLAGIFDLIPRTRITDVGQPATSVLFIAVECECHADAFELRAGRVAIDIKDGPPPRTSRFEAQLPALTAAGAETADLGSSSPEVAPQEAAPSPDSPPQAAETETAAVEIADPPAEQTPAAPIPAPEADRPEASSAVIIPLPEVPMMVPELPGSPFAEDPDTTRRVRAFEELILDQIARAGAQGLVEPLPAIPVPDAPAPVEAVDVARPPVAAEPPETGDHIRVETAADRDRTQGAPVLERLGDTCVADTRLDLASWGHLPGGRPDISSYRDQLSGEFDDVDPDKVLALARYYLFLTFGAEAENLLEYLPEETTDRPLLLSLAESIDRIGPGPWIAPFQGLQTCPTAAAMWALLSGPLLEPGADLDEEAVLGAFSALPEHAKRHLGPRLVEALRAAGRAESAEIVRNRMELAGVGGEVEAAVAGARLDSDLGRTEEARTELEEVLDEVDPDSPEALLALAETRLSAGDAIDGDLLTALESVSYNLRGTEVGNQIDRVLAESHISRSEWLVARDLAMGSVGAIDTEKAADLLRRIYLGASADPDSAAFLRLVVPEPKGLGVVAADAPARLGIARRLLDLGFPEDSLSILGPLATDLPDGRMIAGEAHLSAGRPEAAIEALTGLTGTTRLIAQAHEAAGRFDVARTLYEQEGATEDAARMSLKVSDWADLAGRGDAPLNGAAARLAEGPPESAPDAGPQRQAADLIARSQADRAAFDKLLPVP